MTIVAGDDVLQIEKFELGPFGTNAYLLTCRETREAVLVDAPGEEEKILDRLKTVHPRYILMTHNHMDHVGAIPRLKSELKVPLAAHSADARNLGAPADLFLNDADTVSFGKVALRVLHTPGHTPGSLCYLTGRFLVSGDTLFPGGPGKTGSPAAFKTIVESITRKIFPLPDDTEVYPGHGEGTVLRKEKEAFQVFSSKPHSPNLCGDVLWLSS